MADRLPAGCEARLASRAKAETRSRLALGASITGTMGAERTELKV